MPKLSGDLSNLTAVTFTELASDPTAPASESGKWRTFFKSDGLYLINDEGTVYGPVQTLAPAPALKYAEISERYASGTEGGAYEGGGQTRALNTVVKDDDSIVIGEIGVSHEITLDPGTYYMSAESVMVGVGTHVCYIGQTAPPGGDRVGIGIPVVSPAGVGGVATASGMITISVQSSFGVFEYAEAANEDTNALGAPANVFGFYETYATLKIWKVG